MQFICQFLVYIFFFFVTTIGHVDQPKNCENLKRGKFHYSFYHDNKLVRYMIERNDSTEIQTEQDSGDYFKYDISWEDKCKYFLTTFGTNKNITFNQFKLAQTRIIHNKILIITDSYYTVESNIHDLSKKIIDTIWIDK